MKNIAHYLYLKPHQLWWLAGLLLLPALVINLGLMTFIGDEGIRANVALEMMLSGDYVVPTINGEPYLNKPPLYNWILAFSFWLFGQPNEWAARVPTLVFLLLYAALCVVYLQRFVPRYQALWVAAMVVTCGRILFWDSLLGLIDICFSLVVFANFLWIFHWTERQQWWWMFIGSWSLTVIAFMLKGLPALVFQVFTLAASLALQAYEQSFSWKGAWGTMLRRGISLPNGIGLFMAVVALGSYYYAYAQQAPLVPLLERLFAESAKRTAVQYGLGKTLIHLFTFPFEMVYHFFPWSLMSLLLLAPGALQQLWAHRLMRYFVVVFMANIWVYWASVEVYPRYLLMFLPLLFLPFAHLYTQTRVEHSPYGKGVAAVWRLFAVLACVGALLPLFMPQRLAQIEWRIAKSLILFGLCVWVSVHIWRKPARTQVPALVVLLLVVRLGFDWFVLPDRLREDWGTVVRATTIETAQKASAAKQPLWLYKQTWIPATNSFYLSAHTGQIVKRNDVPGEFGWYIVDTSLYRVPLQLQSEFKIRHGRRTMYVGPLLNVQDRVDD